MQNLLYLFDLYNEFLPENIKIPQNIHYLDADEQAVVDILVNITASAVVILWLFWLADDDNPVSNLYKKIKAWKAAQDALPPYPSDD